MTGILKVNLLKTGCPPGSPFYLRLYRVRACLVKDVYNNIGYDVDDVVIGMIERHVRVSQHADLVPAVPAITVAMARWVLVMSPFLYALAVVFKSCGGTLRFGWLIHWSCHSKAAGSNNGSCGKCRKAGDKLA